MWDNTLTITRGIRLHGRGMGQTTIAGKRRLISWQPNTTAQTGHETLEIAGFTLDGEDATGAELGYAGVIYGTASSPTYVYMIVRDNQIKRTTGTGVYLSGPIYGVASSNHYDMVAMPIRLLGSDYLAWQNEEQEYGTADNFYFEDNVIGFSSIWPTGSAGWIETGQGRRIVVRYNTWDETNAGGPGEFWDVHGLQNPRGPGPSNCEACSTMVAGYYGNEIINQRNAYRWMYHRGGWLLMFYNRMSGNTSPGNGVTQYFSDACQTGKPFVQKVSNTYFWRNIANGVEKGAAFTHPGAGYGVGIEPLMEDVDFFNYNALFDGTRGVGCGPLASRPATCTVGVAYWATDQSTSDLTGMVGAKPRTPIRGTLYKCTAANTWTEYYTPYSYPHPLLGGRRGGE